jgi:hypothetical protein
MADDTSATIIQLHQPKRPKTAAERGRAFRQRQREKAGKIVREKALPPAVRPTSEPFANVPNANANGANVLRTPSRRSFGAVLLTVAAFGLGLVGITMNGWFARSLGATETAGYLFLAIGVAADLVALAVPSVAAKAWQARQRATAAAGWLVWAVTFAFAITAGIGFASVNISDVALQRSARITPALSAAQTALADAMAARDRECKGGVGRFCREREQGVVAARSGLDTAMASVASTADPQTEAAIRIVAWVSRGALNPSGNDFGMLRLILLALLPQVGGILLMVGRNSQKGAHS